MFPNEKEGAHFKLWVVVVFVENDVCSVWTHGSLYYKLNCFCNWYFFIFKFSNFLSSTWDIVFSFLFFSCFGFIWTWNGTEPWVFGIFGCNGVRFAPKSFKALLLFGTIHGSLCSGQSQNSFLPLLPRKTSRNHRGRTPTHTENTFLYVTLHTQHPSETLRCTCGGLI